MHEVLRQRLMRRIESLPEAQIYQVLDYIEFLEAKYAGDMQAEASGLQRFAERVEDKLRRKAMSPATLREAFQLISAADKALSKVSKAGKQIMEELTGAGAGEDGGRGAPTDDAPAGPAGDAGEESSGEAGPTPPGGGGPGPEREP
ncbi:MAG: DUF2281 domain-containing protein [Gemmatimonadetes bacterium]|nr:MAG: DUF2281 domain-containing protein [Gemmatimonadota bacterium]